MLNTLGFEKEAMQLFGRMNFFQRFWLARGSGARLNHHAVEIQRRYLQVDQYMLPMVRQVRHFVKFLVSILLVILYLTYWDNVQDTFQEGIAGGVASFLSSGIDKPVKKPGVKFSDIIVICMLNQGIDEYRAEVEDLVDFLKNPDKYIEAGAKMPKGILFHGMLHLSEESPAQARPSWRERSPTRPTASSTTRVPRSSWTR